MSTILTDDERPKLPPSRYSRWNSSNGLLAFSADQMDAYADAREAAVLAKLAQQADRQRVPDEWRMALELFVSKKRNTAQANIAAELVAEFERMMTVVAAPSCAEQASERHLRRLLAARVGMPNTYYDDGEAQGAEHGIYIDFMREPVADIEAKLRALNVARAMLAAAPEAPAQCDTPRYCASVQRCTADDERRASTPAQASAVDERDRQDAERYRHMVKEGDGRVYTDPYGIITWNFQKNEKHVCDAAIDAHIQARAALAQKGRS